MITTVLGYVIGMLAPNQMSTGVIGMPVMIGFLLIPIFATLNETLNRIGKFFPTYGFNGITKTLFTGGNALDMALHGQDYMVIGIWILLGLALFAVIYRKIGIE
jgi:ABC-2 type transport system permease protein